MGPENRTLPIDDVTWPFDVAPVLAQEPLIVFPCNEADLLTVRLIGHGEMKIPRNCPSTILGHSAQGEKDAAEVMLLQRVQHVGLVLARIQCLLEYKLRAVLIVLDSCIVSCCNKIHTKLVCTAEKSVKAHELIAAHAWVWCTALQVLPCEIIHHGVRKLLPKIWNVVGNIQCGGHAARVVDRVDSAATLHGSGVLKHAGPVPDLHRDANDTVPRLGKQCRADRAVNATTHANKKALLGCHV